MTRYFFDSSDGDFVDIDEDGIELSSDGEARLSALDALPDMARAVMPNGDCRLFTVSVRREDGGVLPGEHGTYRKLDHNGGRHGTCR